MMDNERKPPTGYYCEHCEGFVLAQLGKFEHPDLGQCTCAICRECGEMVHQRIREYA